MSIRRFSEYLVVAKSMRSESVLTERQEILRASDHMLAFVEYAAKLRRPESEVPDFDPLDGGDEVRVLFLMEKPGPKTSVANGGSGFISRNNNDLTVANCYKRIQEAGVPREASAIWNVIPWWNCTIALTVQERREGIEQIPKLLDLFPQLPAVVLVGLQAQRAADAITIFRHDLNIFRSPHPSNQNHVNHPAILSE
jgi:hypothetical protein